MCNIKIQWARVCEDRSEHVIPQQDIKRVYDVGGGPTRLRRSCTGAPPTGAPPTPSPCFCRLAAVLSATASPSRVRFAVARPPLAAAASATAAAAAPRPTPPPGAAPLIAIPLAGLPRPRPTGARGAGVGLAGRVDGTLPLPTPAVGAIALAAEVAAEGAAVDGDVAAGWAGVVSDGAAVGTAGVEVEAVPPSNWASRASRSLSLACVLTSCWSLTFEREAASLRPRSIASSTAFACSSSSFSLYTARAASIAACVSGGGAEAEALAASSATFSSSSCFLTRRSSTARNSSACLMAASSAPPDEEVACFNSLRSFCISSAARSFSAMRAFEISWTRFWNFAYKECERILKSQATNARTTARRALWASSFAFVISLLRAWNRISDQYNVIIANKLTSE